MKLFKILSHPYTLIISFLLILISGRHLGGFYLLYIIMGLPHGVLHAWLALGGIAVLLFSHLRFKGGKIKLINPLLNLAGLGLLVSSILFFFISDTENYNSGTFEQTVPLTSLFIAGIIGVCFMGGAIKGIKKTIFFLWSFCKLFLIQH